MNQWQNFSKGFLKESPIFVLFLGLCPTLGVTSTAINGMGMGLATAFVSDHVQPGHFPGKEHHPG